MENSTESRVVGRCPVCGEGNIIRTEHGYCCDARKPAGGKKCGFIIHNRHHGIDFDDELARKLITDGSTEEMTMWNVNGQPFQARFIIVNGKVDVEIKSHYLQGRCPVCGGRIVKTGKGYACENSITQDPLCGFHVPGILANRKITDSEMEDFLAGSAQVLDGFSNNEGKRGRKGGAGLQDCRMSRMRRRYPRQPAGFQLLQLQQPAGEVQVHGMAEHRRACDHEAGDGGDMRGGADA